MTVKVAFTVLAFASVTVASETDTEGRPSSSLIVPSACGSAIAALVTFVKLIAKFSSSSSSTSPLTRIVICFDVSPGAKLRAPLAAA